MSRDGRSRAHPIVEAALTACGDDEKPEEPAHQGGPVPDCANATAVALTIWMATLALELTRPADAEEARRLLALAKSRGRASPADQRLLRAYALTNDDDSPTAAIARLALGCANTAAEGKRETAWLAAKRAAAKTVPIVRDAGESVVEFVRELDRRICAEARGFLDTPPRK